MRYHDCKNNTSIPYLIMHARGILVLIAVPGIKIY